MKGIEREIRRTASYRVWIDEKGVGNLRIVKRINLKTLISLCREIYQNIETRDNQKSWIIIYMPRSLHDEMSGNVLEFIQFCQSCTDTTFELNVIH